MGARLAARWAGSQVGTGSLRSERGWRAVAGHGSKDPRVRVIPGIPVLGMAIDSVPAPVTELPPTDAVIAVQGLVKSFGTTLVLDQLALEVVPGEVHGLLGPNGAGKTTTLRILLGLLRADAGTVRVLGGDPWHDAASLHRRLAYVPGDVTLWPNLTGGEVIDMIGRMRGGLDRARRDDLIARFDLDPTKKGRTYSKGNRQKVALVAALASDVELLLLDEPTAGLDPLMDADLPGAHRGRPGRRSHRAAEQPHPVGGGGPLRPREHHPPGRRGGVRDAGPAAAPDPDVGGRGGGRWSRPGSTTSPGCTTWRWRAGGSPPASRAMASRR